MTLITSSPSPSISTNNLTNNITSEIDYKKDVEYLVDNSKDMKMVPLEFVLPIPEGERPLMAIDGSIPVIDLSRLNGSDEQRLSTIHIAHWGFFRVTNYGIKTSIMDEMLKVIEELFNLPLEEKMRYDSENVRYGTSLNTTKSITSIGGTFSGTITKVLSNGKYKSVEHRAIVNVEEAQISIAVGHGPKMDAIFQPEIPLIKEKSESKY